MGDEMKKLFLVILTASSLVLSAACAASRATSEPPKEQKPKETEEIWTMKQDAASSPHMSVSA
jgi:hypothetical protein